MDLSTSASALVDVVNKGDALKELSYTDQTTVDPIYVEITPATNSTAGDGVINVKYCGSGDEVMTQATNQTNIPTLSPCPTS